MDKKIPEVNKKILRSIARRIFLFTNQDLFVF